VAPDVTELLIDTGMAQSTAPAAAAAQTRAVLLWNIDIIYSSSDIPPRCKID
jgi:hypothetical protein